LLSDIHQKEENQMKNFLQSFFRDTASYLSISVIVVLLFLFFYFVTPDYWFLCSVFTIIIAAVVEIYLFSKKKKKDTGIALSKETKGRG